MDDITIGVTENVNNISVTAQPNDQIIDIAVTETVETVLLDVSTTVQEVSVTATQNVIVENITVDYVSNENHIDINVTDATQDVTLNVTPTLIEINILRSGGEVNILQFDSLADFPSTGSSDYFYLAKDTNKLYRWTGSAYAEISATANAVWGQIIGTLSEQTDLQNALNLKAPINSPTFTGTVSGITKGMVGLGAVDNTSDLDKPISTATQTALNAKQPLDADLTSIAALSGTYGLLKKTNENSYSIDTNTYLTEITSSDVTDALGFTPENAANKGIANGYASLDGGGKVPSSQLPSYVDDVIEVSSYGTLPSTGETGKIYITLDTNKIYRWTGSVYVEVSSSAAVWGAITGTLSNQTDLQSALDAKLNVTTAASTYYLASNPNGYTSNVGTVNSIAMTVPAAFSVSGSPITSSGTLAVTATGNTTQYIAGDGSLVTFPTMSTAGTLIREVRNTTGATLTKGTVVYISGATGNKPTVSKAIATGDSTSAQTFGLVQADIADNANGNVVCAGDITGIDTSGITEGAQLYLSSTTAGAYTTTKQYAPAHLVYIGIVTRAHPSLGQIEVNIQNGYELDELHNVAAQTPSNNDGLFYESSTSLWKNKSIATVLGYTPANGADYVPLSGDQTIAGLKTFSDFALFDHNIFIKQGTDTSFLSGYNVIDATSSSIFLGLSSGFGANLVLSSLTTQRNFTFPDAAGTIALTSDLAGYVATTGNQSISGTKTFTTQLHANVLKFSESGGFNQTAGFTQIGGTADYFSFANGTNAKSAQFTYGTGTAFNLPNSNGTLALTSQLHDAVTIGTANGLSLSTQVLSLALASTTSTGALSATDWNTFNNKASAASLANYLPLSGGTISTTSSSDALRVVNGGSGYALYVQSNAYFQGNAAFQSLTANAIVKADGSNNLTSAVAGTDYVVPSALSSYLPLSGGTLTGALTITNANLNLSNAYYLTARNNANTAYLGLIGRNTSDKVVVDPDGYGLTVGGAATFSSSVTANGVIYANDNIRVYAANQFWFNSGFRGQIVPYSAYGGGTDYSPFFTSETSLAFGVGGNTNKALMIAANGNVGIGTTTIDAKLDVYTDSGNNIYLSTVSKSSVNIAAQKKGVGYTTLDIEAQEIRMFTATAERMRITSGGKVLIGTTTPTTIGGDNLYIYGTGNVFTSQTTSGASTWSMIAWNSATTGNNGFIEFGTEGGYSARGSITYNRGAGLTVYNTTSDYRIKTDISEFNALNIITKLKPKQYKVIDATNKSIGFIAHELQEFFPQAVSGEKDGKRMQQVDYSQLTGLLTKGVQEVDTKIVNLEKEIISLKAELDTLKNK